MIGFLHGQLLDVEDTVALISVAGVGYEVTLTERFAQQLQANELNTTLTLYTHAHIRDDAHTLFGFTHKQERQLFRLLIKVNSVGTRSGMAFLSVFSVAELVQHIATNDVEALCRVPGIGKKSAQRLLLEMQGKLNLKPTSITPAAGTNRVEARQALLALGFRDAELNSLLPQAIKNAPNASVEELIRLVLQNTTVR